MKKFKTTNGYTVIIDDEDYGLIYKYKWYAIVVEDKVKRVQTLIKINKNKRKCLGLHEAILTKKSGFVIDHINRNTLDNRKSNLRHATKYQNSLNRGVFKNNLDKSKYKGVKWNADMRLWCSSLYAIYKGKRIKVFFGFFKNEKSAAKAYNEAVLTHHGAYGYLNKI